MEIAVVLSVVALWLVVAFQGFILVGVVHSLHRISDHLANNTGVDLTPRILAPTISTRSVTGQHITSAAFHGQRWGAVFVSPHCASCRLSMDELRAITDKVMGKLVIVCQGGAEECVGAFEELPSGLPLLPDPHREISRAYSVDSVPHAVIVGEDGFIDRRGYPDRASIAEGLGSPVSVGG